MKKLAKLADRVLGRLVPKTDASATVCWMEERPEGYCNVCLNGQVGPCF
ncbi:hypothetical protein AB0I28_29120 [Phytomonospora sp. NPDC050363]